MVFKAFLIKYAEIGVKGKNRGIFEDALVQQIKYALKRCGGDFAVHRTRGRIYVDVLSEEYDYDETVEHLQRVFGIAEICPMVQVEDEGFDKLCGTLVEYMDDVYADKHITFKVNARRARKNYPLDSMTINSEVGGVLLDAFPDMKVDVHLSLIHISIERGNVRYMEEELSACLQETISFYDYAENYYHGFLTGLLKTQNKYRVISNQESGLGRPDIIMKSASIRGLAIIMELKVADDFSEMEAGCIQALNQIETRKYSMELEMEGYKDIIKYGICFYKKECMVLKI